MREACLLLVLLVTAAAAAEMDRALRDLRSDDRERRGAALEALADGRLRPATRRDRETARRALERLLSDRFPGVERALAVRALSRLEPPPLSGPLLRRLHAESDDRVLHAAEEAFRHAPAAMAEEIAKCIDREADPLTRAALVRVLGAVPGEDARRRIRLRASIADHWCPRATAALALAHDRHPEALPPLIAMLDSDEPGLLAAAQEALTTLTGLRHGTDPAAWRAWWETRGRSDPLAEPPAPEDPEGRRRYAHEEENDTLAPYWFGIPVRARKVAFVCDVSGSMRTKLPLAYDQLARAVKGLPSRCLFEVIFFNEQVWPWRSRLSHADPVTKELLVRHLPTIEIKSYTNLFDAMEQGLALGVDELFVISDGEPNRGRRQHPRDILDELRRVNTGRAVIHTVSVIRVVDGDDHVDLLARIAEQHGGTHVARTIK